MCKKEIKRAEKNWIGVTIVTGNKTILNSFHGYD